MSPRSGRTPCGGPSWRAILNLRRSGTRRVAIATDRAKRASIARHRSRCSRSPDTRLSSRRRSNGCRRQRCSTSGGHNGVVTTSGIGSPNFRQRESESGSHSSTRTVFATAVRTTKARRAIRHPPADASTVIVPARRGCRTPNESITAVDESSTVQRTMRGADDVPSIDIPRARSWCDTPTTGGAGPGIDVDRVEIG